MPEVTVMGRLALEQRIGSFVHGITDMGPNADGVPRWNSPVCPLVAGLPAQEGEFILGRLSEVARAAQVPLDGEHCRPNLNILISADPDRELKTLHKHAREVLFGHAQPFLIDEFLGSARPVRVWYRTEASSYGIPLGGPDLSQAVPALQAPVTRAPEGGSNLRTSVVYDLRQVFVIVDQRRLRGVSRQQLADYVAVVGLAQIKSQARVGSADTILSLFDAGPEGAPAGLSGWDQAFLKALYKTEQTNKKQRDEMAHFMVSELLPDPRHRPEGDPH